jgi:hypothetical protein
MRDAILLVFVIIAIPTVIGIAGIFFTLYPFSLSPTTGPDGNMVWLEASFVVNNATQLTVNVTNVRIQPSVNITTWIVDNVTQTSDPPYMVLLSGQSKVFIITDHNINWTDGSYHTLICEDEAHNQLFSFDFTNSTHGQI